VIRARGGPCAGPCGSTDCGRTLRSARAVAWAVRGTASRTASPSRGRAPGARTYAVEAAPGQWLPGETAQAAVYCGVPPLWALRVPGCHPGLPSDPGLLTRTSAAQACVCYLGAQGHGSRRAMHARIAEGTIAGSGHDKRARATGRSRWAGRRTHPSPAVGAGARGSITGTRPPAGPRAVSAKLQVGALTGPWPAPLAGVRRTG
jgi:hypothetical protein